VYPRAIYMTGSTKLEQSMDTRRFISHAGIRTPDGMPVLREDRNYITIRGYYNGPDRWVAEHDSQLNRPLDLLQAFASSLLNKSDYMKTFDGVKKNLQKSGYNGSLLSGNDILVTLDPKSRIGQGRAGIARSADMQFRIIDEKIRLKKKPLFFFGSGAFLKVFLTINIPQGGFIHACRVNKSDTVSNYLLTSFLNSAPALNFTAVEAFILIVWPVWGFLPERAFLFASAKLPKPIS